MAKHTSPAGRKDLNVTIDRDVLSQARSLKLNLSQVCEAALAARAGPYSRIVQALTTCAECGSQGNDLHSMTFMGGSFDMLSKVAWKNRKTICDTEFCFPFLCRSCRDGSGRMMVFYQASWEDEKVDMEVIRWWYSRNPHMLLALGALAAHVGKSWSTDPLPVHAKDDSICFVDERLLLFDSFYLCDGRVVFFHDGGLRGEGVLGGRSDELFQRLEVFDSLSVEELAPQNWGSLGGRL